MKIRLALARNDSYESSTTIDGLVSLSYQYIFVALILISIISSSFYVFLSVFALSSVSHQVLDSII